MTSTQTMTTKTNHYFRALVVLAMLASLLAVLAMKPAHADGEFIFRVNFTGDLPDRNVGDGTCDATFSTEDTCTLRAAIQESNFTPETEIIAFDVPQAFRDPGSGVATISPATKLPPITQPVIINGYSQPGASVNTLALGNNAVLKVELEGSKALGGTTVVDGLTILKSSDSLIRGLVINGFSGDGIFLSGDTSSGTAIANNNRIEGNFIGTDPSGTHDVGGLGDGVVIGDGAFNTTVGGTSPSARNLISGNGERGVSILSGSAGNQVQGNYIGTDKSGKADLGNLGSGVTAEDTSNNTIGGTTAAARNVISGNDGAGVAMANGDTQNNKVLGNRIGTTASGTGPLGNTSTGVALTFAAGTSVGDGTSGGANTIAFNGGDGVSISGIGLSSGNSVLSNSIFSNGELGIELGNAGDPPTVNDAGDADTGANGLQNKPVLSSAKTVSGKTTIKGKLNSVPNESYKLQFFSNPSGTNEGKKLIGEKSITTDGSGNRSFTFSPATSVAAGQTITATATRASTHDTSEFSAPRKVASS